MIDVDGIKGKYPKAYSKLVEWSASAVLAMQKAMMMSDEDIAATPKISDDAVKGMLILNTRSLYDFFDENRLFITVDYIHESGFLCNIVGLEDTAITANTRRQAEDAGFDRAFNELENK